jgi:hypothetical protein
MGQRAMRRNLSRRGWRGYPGQQLTLKTGQSMLSHQKAWLGYRRSRKGKVTN